jgi:hypothetical protein
MDSQIHIGDEVKVVLRSHKLTKSISDDPGLDLHPVTSVQHTGTETEVKCSTSGDGLILFVMHTLTVISMPARTYWLKAYE